MADPPTFTHTVPDVHETSFHTTEISGGQLGGHRSSGASYDAVSMSSGDDRREEQPQVSVMKRGEVGEPGGMVSGSEAAISSSNDIPQVMSPI